MGRLWSYATGEKGLNRIRVYERRPGGPVYVEWYDRAGRHQQSLRGVANMPILSDANGRKLAKKLADQMAMSQRRKREGQVAATLLGLPAPHTLHELLEAYSNAHPNWSKKHAHDQRLNARFWELHLRRDTLLTDITPATAAAAMRRALVDLASRDEPAMSVRTQQKRIRYLKDAFTFAQNKLKWIGEEHNLSALDVPKPDSVSLPYSLEEALAVVRASEHVDLRVAAMAHLAWTTGRRADALRQLPTVAYQKRGEYGMLQMPGATDKARKSGQVFITGRAKRVVEQLLVQPAVKASGFIFPSGPLDEVDPARIPERPVSDQWLRDQLRKAEELAGVPNVRGRAFHGLKRRFATAAAPHRAAASKQSGTTEQTLQHAYEQDDPGPKKELAKYLDALIEEEESVA